MQHTSKEIGRERFRRQTGRRNDMYFRHGRVTGNRRVATPQQSRRSAPAGRYGFRWGQKGTHTSRTIMLERASGGDGQLSARRNARRLPRCDPRGQLPGQAHRGDPEALQSAALGVVCARSEVPLFRLMRRCWYADLNGQAISRVAAGARTRPAARASAPPVLRMRPGEELARQQMTDALNERSAAALTRARLIRWCETQLPLGRNRDT